MCCVKFLHNEIYKNLHFMTVVFCVNINFQIPCILTEDTTATTAPPAKAPP